MQVYSTQHRHKLSLSEAAKLLLMMCYESPPHASMAFCEADWNSQRSLLEKEVNSKNSRDYTTCRWEKRDSGERIKENM